MKIRDFLTAENFVKVTKGILSIVAIVLVGTVLWHLFSQYTNTPYKVRITNVTGRSATVSWVTDRPSKGYVLYKKDEELAPGIFSFWGAQRAYDDRDMASALIESSNNEEREEEGLKIDKVGSFYVHHVTVTDLEEGSFYNFKVGNGIRWWGQPVENKEVVLNDWEVAPASVFNFLTFSDPSELPTPNPAYGAVVAMNKDADGNLVENTYTDSIVYAFAKREDGSDTSLVVSSVTNNDGGWTIDKSNLRSAESGELASYEEGKDILFVHPQYENIVPENILNLVMGENDNPAPPFWGNYNDSQSLTQEISAAIKNSLHPFVFNTLALIIPGNNIPCPDGDCSLITPPKPPTSNTPTQPPGSTGGGGNNNNNQNSGGSCTGRYATGCQKEDPCKCKDETGRFKTLEGVDCRPPSCANFQRGECDLGPQGQCLPRTQTKTVINSDGTQAEVKVLCQGEGCNNKPASCTEGETRNNTSKYPGWICKDACKNGQYVYVSGSCRNSESTPTPSPGGSNGGDDGSPINNHRASCPTGYVCQDGVWDRKSCAKFYSLRRQDGILQCIPDQEGVRNVNCPNGQVLSYGSDGQGSCVLADTFNFTSVCCQLKFSYSWMTRSACVTTNSGRLADPGMCARSDSGQQVSVCCREAGGRSIWTSKGCERDESLVESAKSESQCKAIDTSKGCYQNTAGFREWRENTTSSSYEKVSGSGSENMCGYCCVTDSGTYAWKQDAINCNVSQNVSNKKDCSGVVPGVVQGVSTSNLETDVLGVSENSKYINYFSDLGLYTVTLENKDYKFNVSSNSPTVFYIERNGKTGYQAPTDINTPKNNEDLLIDRTSSQIKIQKSSSGYALSIDAGINLVSFPVFLSYDGEKPYMASDLLKSANIPETYIEYIAYFEAGKWVGGIHAVDGGGFSGKDFPLIFGRGYLIKTLYDFETSLPAYDIKSPSPVALTNGWNLVGVNGYKTNYLASSLISSINTIPETQANNVTWWPTSKGRYESYQVDVGATYGFDFPISDKLGYFVKLVKLDPKSGGAVIWNPGGELHGKPAKIN